ncbi:hypothetical protein EJ05DRAFT_484441 [Pseudovirgaria hyperparasitica]|uniref:Uncharacterized protein n=1 Tax=Pseudovirgaria hyperparasitica TaxID=470096 RepID=A0A6A6W9F7_9PEZI|nr:uncharacterized protein EJ05DRAFT_484441 [Pseudovirgaria hyperparasitica]KAF2759492.1 hypothetical protein EJ05DRAFT_484441 [Pseudovirgaria hyperparasitica]
MDSLLGSVQRQGNGAIDPPTKSESRRLVNASAIVKKPAAVSKSQPRTNSLKRLTAIPTTPPRASLNSAFNAIASAERSSSPPRTHQSQALGAPKIGLSKSANPMLTTIVRTTSNQNAATQPTRSEGQTGSPLAHTPAGSVAEGFLDLPVTEPAHKRNLTGSYATRESTINSEINAFNRELGLVERKAADLGKEHTRHTEIYCIAAAAPSNASADALPFHGKRPGIRASYGENIEYGATAVGGNDHATLVNALPSSPGSSIILHSQDSTQRNMGACILDESSDVDPPSSPLARKSNAVLQHDGRPHKRMIEVGLRVTKKRRLGVEYHKVLQNTTNKHDYSEEQASILDSSPPSLHRAVGAKQSLTKVTLTAGALDSGKNSVPAFGAAPCTNNFA